MPELSAPAFSSESLTAAVRNGADSVYIRVSEHPVKKGRLAFSYSEIGSAAEYCRIRGVRLRVLADMPVHDGDFDSAVRLAQAAQAGGADAIIVRDFGLLRVLHRCLPEMPLHLSSVSGIHNLDGALFAKSLGAVRICLSPELPKERVCFIARHSGLETEISCCSPLCISYRHLCFFDQSNPAPGRCSECGAPCLGQFSIAGKSAIYPMSLKHHCIIGDSENIKLSEVTAVRVDVSDERPEYIGAVTGIAARALCTDGRMDEADARLLSQLMPPGGYTNAFFDGNKGAHMLAVPAAASTDPDIFAQIREDYQKNELPRVPLEYFALIRKNETVKLGAQDPLGNTAAIEGPMPEPAFHRRTDKVTLQTQLFRALGTPYTLGSLHCRIDPDVYLPREKLEPLQRKLFDELTEKRRALKPRPSAAYTPSPAVIGQYASIEMNISVSRAAQLSPELAGLRPDRVIIPIGEYFSCGDAVTPFLANGHTVVAVSLPPVVWDGEDEPLRRQIARAASLGVKEIYVADPGQAAFCEKLPLSIRGDTCIQASNSETIDIYKNAGFDSVMLPFDLSFRQIREISKLIAAELTVYGRLPLLVTESCLIKNSSGVCTCSRPSELRDRSGACYPVARTSGCRNIVYSPLKLFLADKTRLFPSLGVAAVRLSFTTENAHECLSVTERFLGLNDYEPGGYFRGWYGRA